MLEGISEHDVMTATPLKKGKRKEIEVKKKV
jgi:hypothetical protein